MLVPKLVTTLQGYTRAQFTADLTAGVIVGTVALPLAIAVGMVLASVLFMRRMAEVTNVTAFTRELTDGGATTPTVRRAPVLQPSFSLPRRGSIEWPEPSRHREPAPTAV